VAARLDTMTLTNDEYSTDDSDVASDSRGTVDAPASAKLS